jgi:hypothetical protein
MPFTETAFLDVFGGYNEGLWPVIAALWVITVVMAARWWWRGRAGREWLVLLAVHWAWSGAVYHWLFFRPINPAAAAFAALFVVQAALFVWLAATSAARFHLDHTARGIVGFGLVIYALAYPFAGLAAGLEYPRVPLFAVPCPTAILTTGFLLASPGQSRWVGVVPALWAAIGSTAAVTLGVAADYVLVPCAIVLALDVIAPHALGRGIRPPTRKRA